MTLSERINNAIFDGMLMAEVISPRISPLRRLIVIDNQSVDYLMVGDELLADAICNDEHSRGVIDRALAKVGY